MRGTKEPQGWHHRVTTFKSEETRPEDSIRTSLARPLLEESSQSAGTPLEGTAERKFPDLTFLPTPSQ